MVLKMRPSCECGPMIIKEAGPRSKNPGRLSKKVQFNRLRKRFATFLFVLKYEGVWWDQEKNYVYATDEVWTAMCEEKQLAKIYRDEGEEEWESLKYIFGLPADQEPNHDYIVISSDEEHVSNVEDDVVESKPKYKIGQKMKLVDYPKSDEAPDSPVTSSNYIHLESTHRNKSIFLQVNRKLFHTKDSLVGQVVGRRKETFEGRGANQEDASTSKVSSTGFDVVPVDSKSEQTGSTSSCSPFKLA